MKIIIGLKKIMPLIETVSYKPDRIFHCTTFNKLKKYNKSKRILQPVRGFDTKFAAKEWCKKTGRNIILEIKTIPIVTHKLPDHHVTNGRAWWIESDILFKEENIMQVTVLSFSNKLLKQENYRNGYAIKTDKNVNLKFIEGEPEDASISRDYNDVFKITDLIEVAYQAGMNKEKIEIIYKETDDIEDF